MRFRYKVILWLSGYLKPGVYAGVPATFLKSIS